MRENTKNRIRPALDVISAIHSDRAIDPLEAAYMLDEIASMALDSAEALRMEAQESG